MLGINLSQLPVDPLNVITRINKKSSDLELEIYLEPYSENEYAMPKAIQILRAKKCEAITTIDPQTGIYHIRYDDGSHIPQDRLHFTLAHEIAHAVLDHPIEFGIACARSGGIMDKNHPAEREADTFAAELLRPAILMALIGADKAPDIQDACDISYLSACVAERQVDTVKRFMYQSCKAEIRFYMHQFHDYVNRKYCTNCDYLFVDESASFCPICGNKNLKWGNRHQSIFLFKEWSPVKYPMIELDANGKAVICPVCGNEQLDQVEEYCQVCGTYLVNKCVGTFLDVNDFGDPIYSKSCGRIESGNARFCSHCGGETSFGRNKVLNDWKEARDNIKSNDPKIIKIPKAVSGGSPSRVSIDDIPF